MRTLLILFFTSLLKCYGQQVSTLHFGLDEGLLSTEVYDLLQDRNGFIWIATDNGVARYDGNKILNYQANNGLTDPVVFGLSEDAKSRIWFRTFSGKVSYFQNGVIKAYKYNHLIEPYCKSSLLQSFYIDANDNVWFGTGEMFGKISNYGLLEIQRLKTRQIECTVINDEVVFGYPWPHQFIDAASIDHKVYHIDLSDKINHILNVPVIKSGPNIIIALGKDIFEFKNHEFIRAYTGKNKIISLSMDEEKNVWAGFMKGGVIKFSGADFSVLTSVDFLHGMSVTKVLNDHEGGYWFSTLENGIYRVPDFNIIYSETPAHSKIKAVASDGERAYMGLEDGCVFSVDRDFKMKRIKEPGDPMLTMFVDSRKRVWASSVTDTHIYDSTGHETLYYPISQNDIFENRDAIWGVSRTRLNKFNFEKTKPDNVAIPFLYRFISGYDSSIVLSGRTGLDVYDGHLKGKIFSQLFQNHKVSKVFNLNDSLILLSSVGSGFFVLDKKTWGDHFLFNVKVMGDNIYSVIKVDSSLWLGTEQGIAITAIQNLINRKPLFDRLTNQNGLVKNKISSLKKMGPSIFAFSENTFYSIPGRKKIRNKPTFYLESVRVNNRPISKDSLSKLNYSQNNLQINFGFISFNNQNILIRSRLSKKEIWSYTRTKELSYNALSPGDYDLEIQYSVDNYRWYPASERIRFAIDEPWWLNKFLQLGVFCAVVGLIYFVSTNQISMLKETQKLMEANARFQEELLRAEHVAMEKERSRISKDLHDGIGASLSGIKISVYKQFKEFNEERIFLTEQIDGAIQEIREIVHDLSPHGIDHDGLRGSLENYFERVKRKGSVITIDFYFYGAERIDLKLSISVFRIVQELVTNTLKHSAATEVGIQISSEESMLVLLYKDNGRGIRPGERKNGHGLHNIESRVNSMNGRMQMQSSESGVSYEISIPTFSDSLGNIEKRLN